jgi:hypothetical protein
MMRTRNLRHVDPFTDCWTFFMNGERYGESFKLVTHKEETLAAFQPAIRAKLCIPQSTGELILSRQQQLLQSLNIMCEDILEIGSTTRNQKSRPKKSTDAATAAMSKLQIKVLDSSPQLDFPCLIQVARDRKASVDDNLTLICTEPVVLAHEVNTWFFSRPELVPDEKGRMLPVHTDKYISGSVLESIHNAVKAAAIWDYMTRLLELLEGVKDKALRPLVLQEISNLCHLEYSRTQALFKRHLSTAYASGSKWFKRASNTFDNGIPRITMKGKPELLQDDPQLLYMLRLSQTDTTAAKAADWILKLDDFQSRNPGASESLTDRETDGIGDMAIVVSFINSLTPVVSMPSFSRKKAQLFTTKSAALEAELNGIKSQLDLRDFAAPIDHLLEPGMTEAALEALNRFLVDQTGTKIGFLYQDLIGECVADLQARLSNAAERQEKAQADQLRKASNYVPFPTEEPKTSEIRVQNRKEKEKTRPAHSSVFEILPAARSTTTEETQTPQPVPILKIKDASFKVFSTLLSPSQSRGSVSWFDFELAMADLSFSILPKFGSVYTFFPPTSMANHRPLTLHRPHNSRIEGYKLLYYARRLKRVYGWTLDTFEVL